MEERAEEEVMRKAFAERTAQSLDAHDILSAVKIFGLNFPF